MFAGGVVDTSGEIVGGNVHDDICNMCIMTTTDGEYFGLLGGGGGVGC